MHMMYGHLSNSDSSIAHRNPIVPINVLIVGAGLGGLSAAISILHESNVNTNRYQSSTTNVNSESATPTNSNPPNYRITILEKASELSEVGAGIQIPPNSSRILKKWGLEAKFAKESVRPGKFLMRRYSDGEVLCGYHGLLADGKGCVGHEEEFGGPYWHIHRADFHKILVERVRELGVEIRLGCTVTDILLPPHCAQPTVHLTNGETFTADLIIGADGLKSRCREIVLGRKDPPLNAGDQAYRILVQKQDIVDYEEKRIRNGGKDIGFGELLERPNIDFWLGPNGHAVCYQLKCSSLYNVVLIVPENLPPDIDIAPADPDELRSLFKDWDPRLQALVDISTKASTSTQTPPSLEPDLDHSISTIDDNRDLPPTPPKSPRLGDLNPTTPKSTATSTLKIQKWRLQNIQPLPTWIGTNAANLVLLGDACHATLPYLAQGAAMAVEDGHVLGLVLAKLKMNADGHGVAPDLSQLLQMYQDLRKPRTEWLVRESTRQKEIVHMPNGREQERRDTEMREWEERMKIEGGRGEEDGGEGFCGRWSDAKFRRTLFGYRGEEEVEKAWAGLVSRRDQEEVIPE
ncbi:hypothetical protein DFH27DRAFT_51728 [Peziza echinospora]|nr:hypothetical protein DFH27DRAFT_51728 [Peziza echinospora]